MNISSVTFDRLPQAVADLQVQLTRIEAMLCEQQSVHPLDRPDLLTVSEAAELLHLAPQTIYQKVSARELPFSKKGKRLYFRRSELDSWIAKGRRATKAEIADTV